MIDLPLHARTQKKDWTLTEPALGGLLRWLDEGEDSGGEKFLEMRRRLVAYFDRKNCFDPDELADETISRLARRVEEEGAIERDTPMRYCYIMARFVFMEYLRKAKRDDALVAEMQRQSRDEILQSEEAELKEKMLSCLDQCTGKLDPASREIIMRYYLGRERAKIENRRSLASSLSITMNALSIRACRIRDKLEACVKECASLK